MSHYVITKGFPAPIIKKQCGCGVYHYHRQELGWKKWRIAHYNYPPSTPTLWIIALMACFYLNCRNGDYRAGFKELFSEIIDLFRRVRGKSRYLSGFLPIAKLKHRKVYYRKQDKASR